MLPDGRFRAFVLSIIEQLLWARGWEEPVGPLGPFLSRGHPVPWLTPSPWLGAQPEPWLLGHGTADRQGAVNRLVQGAQIKEVAARLSEGQHRTALIKAASDAIKNAIDELCPRPRAIPWPKPHWAFEIVSELARVADSSANGAVRDELLDAAAEVARRGLEDGISRAEHSK